MNKLILVILIVIVLYIISRTEFYSLNKKEPLLSDEGINMSEYSEENDKISITNDLMQEMILRTNEEVSKKTGLCTYIIETTEVKKYTHKITGSVVYRCMFMVVKHGGFDFGFLVTSDIKVINEGPRYDLRDLSTEYEDGRQFGDILEETKKSVSDRLERKNELNEIEKIRLKQDEKKLKELERDKNIKINEKPEVSILYLKTQTIYINPPSDISVFTNPTNKQEFQDYTLVRQSELDVIKNNNFIEKEILDSQTMYGDRNRVVTPLPIKPKPIYKEPETIIKLPPLGIKDRVVKIPEYLDIPPLLYGHNGLISVCIVIMLLIIFIKSN